jgi:hypothetical protein
MSIIKVFSGSAAENVRKKVKGESSGIKAQGERHKDQG